MKKNAILESVMRIIFFIAACASVLAVVLICVFLFANGIPAMGEVGIFKFLFGQLWRPSNDIYGILPFILGSIYVTAGAIVVGVPLALLTSIFLARHPPSGFQMFQQDRDNISLGHQSELQNLHSNRHDNFLAMCCHTSKF